MSAFQILINPGQASSGQLAMAGMLASILCACVIVALHARHEDKKDADWRNRAQQRL